MGLFGLSTCIFFTGCVKEQLLISSQSPNRDYTLTITYSRPTLSLDNFAYLDVTQDGESLIDRKVLYRGDYFDGVYTDYYPLNRWTTDSVFHSGQHRRNSNAQVNLTNHSRYNYKYILIETYREKLIIFNFERGSNFSTDFHFTQILSVEGVRAETEEVFGKAIGTSSIDDESSFVEFFVEMTDSEPLITSAGRTLSQKKCFGLERNRICEVGRNSNNQ
jgi:hypothetical protein